MNEIPSDEIALANIIGTYRRASDHDLGARTWYHAAHTFSVGLSERYGVDVATAAAVVAVLSPRLEWSLNMAYADRYLRTGWCPTFTRTLAKLAAIVDDGPGATYSGTFKRGDGTCTVVDAPALSGRKVVSFFLCILNPDATEAVCIDRHAYDVAVGRVSADDERSALDRKGVYDRIANLYRQAAAIIGIAPHELQAITWTTWKRTKQYARPQHATLYQSA